MPLLRVHTVKTKTVRAAPRHGAIILMGGITGPGLLDHKTEIGLVDHVTEASRHADDAETSKRSITSPYLTK